MKLHSIAFDWCSSRTATHLLQCCPGCAPMPCGRSPRGIIRLFFLLCAILIPRTFYSSSAIGPLACALRRRNPINCTLSRDTTRLQLVASVGVMRTLTPPRHAESRLRQLAYLSSFITGAYLEKFWAPLPDRVVDNNIVSRAFKTTLVWSSSDHTLHLIKHPRSSPLIPLPPKAPFLSSPSIHPFIPPPLPLLFLVLPPPSLPSHSHPATGQHEPRTPETVRPSATKRKTNRSYPCPPLRSTSSRHQPPAPPDATILPSSAPPTVQPT
jgi:hypothetical protein